MSRKKTKRPQVIVNCVADAHALDNERIVEVRFPDGKGCLIALRWDEKKTTPNTIHIYRAEKGIVATAYGRAESGMANSSFKIVYLNEDDFVEPVITDDDDNGKSTFDRNNL